MARTSAFLRIGGRSIRIRCSALSLQLTISFRRLSAPSKSSQGLVLEQNKPRCGDQDDLEPPTNSVHIVPALLQEWTFPSDPSQLE
jgi:hypothetical protein